MLCQGCATLYITTWPKLWSGVTHMEWSAECSQWNLPILFQHWSQKTWKYYDFHLSCFGITIFHRGVKSQKRSLPLVKSSYWGYSLYSYIQSSEILDTRNTNEWLLIEWMCWQVINSGDHGRVSKVTLVVQWPYEIASTGEYLLYMITTPKLPEDMPPGKGQCHVSDEYINSLKLEVKCFYLWVSS